MALPNFIVVGAQKAGTTSLYNYLMLHPQIFMSREKELNFFIQEKNWLRGIDWYESNFGSSAPQRGEASPLYASWPEHAGVPERMHAVVPDAKLLYLVRDPIQRIISHYVMDYGRGMEDRDITDALHNLDETNVLVCRSKYYLQIQQYLSIFKEQNICIVSLDDLQADPQQTLGKIFRFLGVDEFFVSPGFSRIHHPSSVYRRPIWMVRLLKRALGNWAWGRRESLPRFLCDGLCPMFYPYFSYPVVKPCLTPVLRQRLVDCLKDDVDRLRTLTGNRFEKWSL